MAPILKEPCAAPLSFHGSAVLGFGFLATLALIKWSEAASPRRLRQEIQQQVFLELDLYSHLAPHEIEVEIESIDPIAHSTWTILEGTLTIPRIRCGQQWLADPIDNLVLMGKGIMVFESYDAEEGRVRFFTSPLPF